MIVRVKDFRVEMEIKNAGIELELRDSQGKHLGDLIINRAKVIWCKGRTNRENGKAVRLEELIEWMEKRK